MANLTRRDANHAEVKAALLAAGRPVKDVAIYGGLGCDLLTEHIRGRVVMLEIKAPGKQKRLTPSEVALRDSFSVASFFVVVTPEDALRAVGLLP